MALTDQMMLDAYTGQGGFADGSYLIRHPRELDDKFTARKDVATYRNYCRKIVGAYVGTLYAHSAQRSGEAQAWQDFQANADGVGGQIDDLMRRALVLSLLLGTVYLVVDRPAGRALSRADEARLAPYAVIRRPQDVAALALDPLGAVVRIVFAEQSGGASYGAGAVSGEPQYRGWDATRWWVSKDAQGLEILPDPQTGQPQTGEHGLGRPPVVRLHSSEILELTAERAAPWAAGIVAASVDLYNRHSEARSIERDQTVSTLALPVSDLKEADRIREKGITIGASNAVLYNPAGGGKPGYFAPPDGPLTLYYQAIAQTIVEIYQLANLEFVGGVAQSGVAMAFHFAAANRTLSLFAQSLELAEIDVGRLVCDWVGQDSSDLRVVYPRSFEVQDLQARLAEDMDALTMGLGETAERLIRSRAARRVLGDNASAADYEAIDGELAEGADPYGDRVAKAAVNLA